MNSSNSYRSRNRRKFNPFTLEHLESRLLLSAATMVADLNPGTQSSSPEPIAVLGNTLLFAATDDAHGNELYKTDGTLAGTSMVADIRSGPQSSLYYGAIQGIVFNNQCYFSEVAPDGNALWKTDGTAAGTVFVQKLNSSQPTYGNTPLYAHSMMIAGGKLYFLAPTDTSSTNSVVWVSDGTTAGTQPLAQITGGFVNANFNGIGVLGNKLYFNVNNDELWSTDGTAAGTSMIKNGLNLAALGFGALNNKLYFFADPAGQGGLWSTDGTTGGTGLVAPLAPSYLYVPYVDGSRLYFFAGDQNNASGTALWTSDGTGPGTSQILGGVGAASGVQYPTINGALANGTLIFQVSSGANQGIWSTTGTAATTQFLSSVGAGPSGVLGNQMIFQGTVYPQSDAIWTTDGTPAGTHALIDINPNGYDSGNFFTPFNGKLFFNAFDYQNGAELRYTDGTAAGTKLLDLNTAPNGSYPHNMGVANGLLYFGATDINGEQPWVSDGTAAGTHLLKAVDAWGQAYPTGWTAAAGKVFFRATSTPYGEFFSTDNTAAGTNALLNSVGQPLGVGAYGSFNNLIYFGGSDSTHGTELWKTDGTTAGTSFVVDLRSGTASSSPGFFRNVGAKLVFDAIDSSSHPQLYSSDGTAGGTIPITTFTGTSRLLTYSAIANGKIYFLYNVSGTGMQLWQSDGTAAGTTLVKLVTPYTGTPQILAVGNLVYFVAPDTTNSSATSLYKSDGTSAGTVRVAVLPSFSSPSSLTASGGKLFFVNSSALWVSNGTAAGTFTISIGGNSSSYPRGLTDAGGILYFSANDGVHGEELCRSDGTQPGTYLVEDLYPGSLDGIETNNPAFQVLGTSLYFDGYAPGHGFELMQLDFQDTLTVPAAAGPITLTRDADNLHIDWTTGTLSGQLHINDAGGLTINGNGANDAITLSYTHGNPLPNILHLNGTFTITGLQGSTPLANTAIDVGQSTVYFNYAGSTSPAAAVFAALARGYNSGAWNGTPSASDGAIFSTNAAAAQPNTFAVGYADSIDGLVTAQPANTVELRFTIAGDTNLDRTVNSTDALQMTRNYLIAGKSAWDQGNFNYDNTINYSDATILQRNYNAVATGSADAATLTQSTILSASTPPTNPAQPTTDSPIPTDPLSKKETRHRKGSDRTKH